MRRARTMRNLFRFSLAATAWAIGLSAAGCMSPPVVWCAAPGSAGFAPSGKALILLPVEDLRRAHNENPSWLGLVPLVIWTTETDDLFEWVLVRSGSRRRMVGSAEIAFDAEKDLQRAMRRQLGRGKLFGPVFISRAQSGPQDGKHAPPWALKTTLRSLTLRREHLHYGLGPLAFVAYLCGAPTKKVAMAMDLQMALSDGSGKLRYEHRLAGEQVFYDGWYWSLDGEQRALDWVAFDLGDAIDAMQQDVSVKMDGSNGSGNKEEGKDYFVQSGKGAASATISRVLYLLFFPVPLPSTWSPNPGRSLFEQVNQSYNSARMGMQNSRMRRNRANIRATLP